MALGRTMAPHSSHPEGLIIWDRPKARGPWTFPLERWMNGGGGRGRHTETRIKTIEVTSRFHLPCASSPCITTARGLSVHKGQI